MLSQSWWMAIMFFIGLFVGWMITMFMIPAITPGPVASLLKLLFKIPAFHAPRNWNEIEESVASLKGIDYGDAGMAFDMHWPAGSLPSDHPVLVWVHGGGFVGGRKEDVTGYCMMIAKMGYTVVNIDYGLAPRYHHPRQVQDLDAVLVELNRLPERIRPVLSRGLFLAGDSAGAHIVAEYGALATNPSYRQKLGVQLNSRAGITGLVLQCGLYDFNAFLKGSWWRRPIRFMTKQIGWSITGNRWWHKSRQTKRMNVVEWMTGDYPPSFLTDGNWWTFDNQLDRVNEKMDELGVPHMVVEFPRKENPRLLHEFQFDLRKPAAQEVFRYMTRFLERCSEGNVGRELIIRDTRKPREDSARLGGHETAA